MNSTTRKRPKKWIAVLVILLISGSIYLVLPYVLQYLLINKLNEAGFIHPETQITHLSRTQVRVEHAYHTHQLASGSTVTITIPEAILTFSLSSLLADQLDALLITAAEVAIVHPDHQQPAFNPAAVLVIAKPFAAPKQALTVKQITLKRRAASATAFTPIAQGQITLTPERHQNRQVSLTLELLNPQQITLNLHARIQVSAYQQTVFIQPSSHLIINHLKTPIFTLADMTLALQPSHLIIDSQEDLPEQYQFDLKLKTSPFTLLIDDYTLHSGSGAVELSGEWQPSNQAWSVNSEFGFSQLQLANLEILRDNLLIRGSLEANQDGMHSDIQATGQQKMFNANVIIEHAVKLAQGRLLYSLENNYSPANPVSLQAFFPTLTKPVILQQGFASGLGEIRWHKPVNLAQSSWLQPYLQQPDMTLLNDPRCSLPTTDERHNRALSPAGFTLFPHFSLLANPQQADNSLCSLLGFLPPLMQIVDKQLASRNWELESEGRLDLYDIHTSEYGGFQRAELEYSGHSTQQLQRVIGEMHGEVFHFTFPNEQMLAKYAKFNLAEVYHNNEQFFIQGEYSIDRLQMVNKLQFNDAINITGQVYANPESLQSKMHIDDVKKIMNGTADLQHVFASDQTTLDIHVNTRNFKHNELSLQSIFPKLQHYIWLKGGYLSFRSHLNWPQDLALTTIPNIAPNAKPKLTLQAHQVDALINQADINGLETELNLVQLNPLISAAQQPLNIEAIKLDLALNQTALTYQLRTDSQRQPQLLIHQLRSHLAGGLMTGQQLRFDLNSSAVQYFPLQLSRINIADIMQLINLEGLTGQGMMNGEAVLRTSPSRLMIDHARLAATPADGYIRYLPTKVHPLFKQHEKAGVLLDVLSDFQFKRFTMALTHPSRDALLTIYLEGANPSFYDGIPLAFNLRVDAPLESLLYAGFIGNRLEQDIRYRIINAIEVGN